MREIKYRSFNLLSLFLIFIGTIGLMLAVFAISNFHRGDIGDKISIIFLVTFGLLGFLYFVSMVLANKIIVYEDRLVINYWKDGFTEATSKLNPYKTEQMVIYYKDIIQFRVQDEMFHIDTVREKFLFEIKLYSKFMLSCFQYKIYQKTNLEPSKTEIKLVNHNYNAFVDLSKTVIFALLVILIIVGIPVLIRFSSLLENTLIINSTFYTVLQLLYVILPFIGGIMLSGVIYSKFIFGKYSTEIKFQKNKVIEKSVVLLTVFIYLILFTFLAINLLIFKNN